MAISFFFIKLLKRPRFLQLISLLLLVNVTRKRQNDLLAIYSYQVAMLKGYHFLIAGIHERNTLSVNGYIKVG